MILGQGLMFVNRSQLLILFFGTFGTPNCSLHVSPSLLLGSKWCELSTSLTHTPPLYTTMASLLGYPLGIFSDCFLKYKCFCQHEKHILQNSGVFIILATKLLILLSFHREMLGFACAAEATTDICKGFLSQPRSLFILGLSHLCLGKMSMEIGVKRDLCYATTRQPCL